jgi:DMSO/TMAO reductase YedYZ molybdopterin-dependent catalytic subunit
MMNRIDRRRFLRLAMGGAALSVLSACGVEGAQPGATNTLPAVPSPLPSTAATPRPTAAAAEDAAELLRNENVPGFFVRYYRPLAPIDREEWTLSVGGLVRQEQALPFGDVLELPARTQTSRMKCVECWSAVAEWQGFHLSTLMELAGAQESASWVQFHCADGYYESMPVRQLLEERVLFVTHMNGQILPDAYGAPLRLMVPFLYGYKSAKAITRIEFAGEELAGYWPTVGPYTTHGTIRAGRDNPLDLEGTRRIEGGSEIFYPDGRESQ